jgi:hypothetical protein
MGRGVSERPRQLRQNNDSRWDFLAGVLPNGINPTDIDLMYERRGHFLVLEGKREGAPFSIGQRRFYNAFHQPPRVIVVHFYGTPPTTVTSFGVWGAPAKPCNTEGLIAHVRTWFEWVERRAVRESA